MSYHKRVVKRRPASLTDDEWLQVWERGKLPREPLRARDGVDVPPVDVSELVYERSLQDLWWRVEILCMTLAKPSTSPSLTGPSSSTLSQGQLLSAFSEIWAFLLAPAYSDGSRRQGGSISLKLQPGGLQATLMDPSSGSYCCLTAPSLDDAFLALEIGLKENTLSWKPSGYGKQKK